MAGKRNVDFKVLDAISVVSKKLSDSDLKIRRTKSFSTAEEQLASYFGITSGAVWMLSAIISYYFDNQGESCNFNDIASFFNSSVMSIIAYSSDIERLLTKGYIRNKYGMDEEEIGLKNEFELSTELIDCILHNKKIRISKKKQGDESTTALVKRMGALISSSEDVNYKCSRVSDIEEKCAHNTFIAQTLRIVTSSSHDCTDRMFFYDACSDFLEGTESRLLRTITDVYGDTNDVKFSVANAFLNERHILLTSGLLEFTRKGCLTDSKLTISSKAKEMLLGENAWLFQENTKGTDIIRPEDIRQKKLFYSAENEEEISRLKDSLQDEKLRSIKERLAEKGLPKGIAVLLYGLPGTGKTESVYQIARETGRTILHVDISNSKSCWFGDKIHALCRSERIESSAGRRIGFGK